MHTLKFICLTFVQLVKHAWFLPQTLSNAVKQQRHKTILNEREAERLDRIRHPDQYLGK